MVDYVVVRDYRKADQRFGKQIISPISASTSKNEHIEWHQDLKHATRFTDVNYAAKLVQRIVGRDPKLKGRVLAVQLRVLKKNGTIMTKPVDPVADYDRAMKGI